MHEIRDMGRQIGTALAVLAIYLLTILAPLHQARATQYELAELGYQTLETGWVLCTPDGARNDRDMPPVKCPAAGIGKDEALEPTVLSGAAPIERTLLRAEIGIKANAALPAPATPPNGSRGPPVLI